MYEKYICFENIYSKKKKYSENVEILNLYIFLKSRIYACTERETSRADYR